MPGPLGSGLAAQFMYATEAGAYGVYTPPTRSVEMVSESLKLSIDRIESKGLRAGRRLVGKWLPGKRSIGGDVDCEVSGTGFGLMFQHMLGSNVVTGAGPVYTQTCTPAQLPQGFTAQVGRPDLGGVIDPFTYLGCRINTWELSVKNGELLMLKIAVVGQDETTAQALGVFADPAVILMSYAGGSISLGGVSTNLVDFTLKGDNKLDAARFRLRGAATPLQPLENSWREYTGTVTADFEALTQYNHYVNGDEFTMVATFNGPPIPAGGGLFYSVTITANVRYDGDTPSVAGPALLTQPLPFAVSGSGATDAAALSLVYTTTDAAA